MVLLVPYRGDITFGDAITTMFESSPHSSNTLAWYSGVLMDETHNTHLPHVKNDNLSLASQNWHLHPHLSRPLSLEQYLEVMDIMRAFTSLCEKHNVTFIMADGTLLGSYFFHDIIPWDDDLDVMVKFEDRDKLIDAFRSKEFRHTYGVTSFQSRINWYDYSYLIGKGKKKYPSIPNDKNNYIKNVLNIPDLKCKIFKMSSDKIGKYKWRYPFIDIKFYQENDTDIWKMDNMDPQQYRIFKSDFYPLHLRPFGKMWLPAPKDTNNFLKTKFREFTCKSGKWNHVKEKHRRTKLVRDCSMIVDYYPHVERISSPDAPKKTEERLIFQNRIISQVIVDEEYHRNYYSL